MWNAPSVIIATPAKTTQPTQAVGPVAARVPR
jgi:hypothetical protein